MSPAAGLGAEDPWARREQAAGAFLPKSPPPPDEEEMVPDQGKPAASSFASTSASKPASIGAEAHKEETPVPTSTSPVTDLPPPPPTREPVGRAQFNQRILTDRRKALDKYRRQHGATWQGLFDQMVDEYLDRRGLLPPSDPQ